ncbi:MAG: extracellular solute-binding protein [Anaerolineae bacterium]|nr:extracellular solute-binding protein [Anaerolineae bacterium]
MKHKWSLVGLLMVILLVLASCAPAPTPQVVEKVVKETVVVEKPVEKTVVVEKTVEVPVEAKPEPITVWARYDLTNTEDQAAVSLKQLITSFEATTGIKVNYEQVAWDQIALKLALIAQSGGEMPDVTELGSQAVPQLVSAGALMDITELVKDTPWASQLSNADAQACIYQGKRYCVTADVRGGAWYYNVADFPNGWPTTPQDWLKEGERLAKEGKYISTFFAGRHYAAVELTWGPWIRSNGGHVFDAEGKPAWATPETVEVVNWARELLSKGYIPETCFTGDFTAGETPWVDGKAASVRGGSWSFLFIPGLKDKINAGETKLGLAPAFKEGKHYVFLVGETWAVPKNAKNPKGALAWLNFFMNPPVLAQYASNMYGIPTIDEAFRASAFDSDFYRETAKNLAENGVFMEQSPYYTESLDALAIALQELMLDPKLDPATHLQQAQDEVIKRYFK